MMPTFSQMQGGQIKICQNSHFILNKISKIAIYEIVFISQKFYFKNNFEKIATKSP